MISDLDSYKLAKLMIDRHGARASLLAGGRAEALRVADDAEGRADWIHVLDAIREFRAPATRPAPEPGAGPETARGCAISRSSPRPRSSRRPAGSP